MVMEQWNRLVDTFQDRWNPEMKANAIAPIADMVEYDFLEPYLPQAKAVTGVFIGSRDRGIVEANAFRLACARKGIVPGTVFIIETDHGSLQKSVERLGVEEEEIKGILEQQGLSASFQPVLSQDKVTSFSTEEFVDAATQPMELPPLVFIEGRGQDPELIRAISQQTPDDQSLFVMARNVNVNSFDYTDMTRNWGTAIAQRNQDGKPDSILAYTADSRRFGKRLHRMIQYALEGLPQGLSLINGDGPSKRTTEVGQRLSHPPRLRKILSRSWLPYSDNYAHVLGKTTVNHVPQVSLELNIPA